MNSSIRPANEALFDLDESSRSADELKNHRLFKEAADIYASLGNRGIELTANHHLIKASTISECEHTLEAADRAIEIASSIPENLMEENETRFNQLQALTGLFVWRHQLSREGADLRRAFEEAKCAVPIIHSQKNETGVRIGTMAYHLLRLLLIGRQLETGLESEGEIRDSIL
tara:strand:+ start:2724 stop:3242 length:519 start_codon:yes stop_codon:yes gene_type:complete